MRRINVLYTLEYVLNLINTKKILMYMVMYILFVKNKRWSY